MLRKKVRTGNCDEIHLELHLTTYLMTILVLLCASDVCCYIQKTSLTSDKKVTSKSV